MVYILLDYYYIYLLLFIICIKRTNGEHTCGRGNLGPATLQHLS